MVHAASAHGFFHEGIIKSWEDLDITHWAQGMKEVGNNCLLLNQREKALLFTTKVCSHTKWIFKSKVLMIQLRGLWFGNSVPSRACMLTTWSLGWLWRSQEACLEVDQGLQPAHQSRSWMMSEQFVCYTLWPGCATSPRPQKRKTTKGILEPPTSQAEINLSSFQADCLGCFVTAMESQLTQAQRVENSSGRSNAMVCAMSLDGQQEVHVPKNFQRRLHDLA